jgi:hypothetical protein
MLGRETKHGSTRHISETLLWAWLIAVATASVIGAIVLFMRP